MKLTILGSGTCVPRSDRGAAGYVVEAAGTQMLFDCGPGTVVRLVRAGLDFRGLDRVFLSHRHPDHCLDVVALIHANSWTPGFRRERPLEIVGPSGTRAWLRAIYAAFPSLEPRGWELRVAEWDRGRAEGDGWDVTSIPVVHGEVPAIAFRVEAGGRSVVYSGDTGVCDGIVEIAREADLLVIECSYPDAIVGIDNHLTASQAGRIAREAGARRVVLTHLYPQAIEADVVGECRAMCGGDVVRAEDGMRVEV